MSLVNETVAVKVVGLVVFFTKSLRYIFAKTSNERAKFGKISYCGYVMIIVTEKRSRIYVEKNRSDFG